jgi:hypothetical protein
VHGLVAVIILLGCVHESSAHSPSMKSAISL